MRRDGRTDRPDHRDALLTGAERAAGTTGPAEPTAAAY
jgi:hypothetical protein